MSASVCKSISFKCFPIFLLILSLPTSNMIHSAISGRYHAVFLLKFCRIFTLGKGLWWHHLNQKHLRMLTTRRGAHVSISHVQGYGCIFSLIKYKARGGKYWFSQSQVFEDNKSLGKFDYIIILRFWGHSSAKLSSYVPNK